jgi:tRNA threonylcarbamoyl adenosine modification protein (Sua5/YciO/YrdC/YwlC family)
VSTLPSTKGRGRNMPPPVLVGTVRAASALVEDLGAFGQDLIDEFWPGPLTLVFRAAPTLQWDLGDTMGTVAVRMPLHPVALEVLKQAGPTAVSSANLTGSPAATTAADAQAQLGASVSVYLDGGPCASDVPSTILDLTGSIPRVLRAGAISVDRLRKVAAIIDDTVQAEPAHVTPVDVKPAEPHPLGQIPQPDDDIPVYPPEAGTSGSSQTAGTPKSSRATGTARSSRSAGTSKSSQAASTSRSSRTTGTSKSSRAQSGDAAKPSRSAGAPKSSRATGTRKASPATDTPQPPPDAG